MGISDWAKRLISGDRRAGAPDAPAPASAAAAIDPVQAGIALLEAGQFEAAADAFRRALELDSASAANHVNLAYALEQAGAVPGALRHLRQAVQLDPASFDAHYMLGGLLEREDDLDAAARHLQRAVDLQPSFEAAHVDLCRVLAAKGDQGAARAAIEAAIDLNPGNADFHYYLGNVCLAEGAPESALESYDRALVLRPNYAEVHSNRGLALHAGGRFNDAEKAFDAALTLDATVAEAHANLALTYLAQRKYEQSTASLRRALALKPGQAEIWNKLGNVALEQGHWDAAIGHYLHAIELSPEEPGAYRNLGLAYLEKAQIDEAIRAFQHGLSIQPAGEIHENLARALILRGEPDIAIEHFRKALALRHDNPDTQTNLAAALSDTGDSAAAIVLLRQVLEKHPEHLTAHNNLVFYMSHSPDCSAAAYLTEAQRYGRKLTRGLLIPPPAPSDKRAGPLRVGFVSGDLRRHPVGFFLEGLLEHLNPQRLELYAYSTTRKEDALTDRIRPKFKRWEGLHGRSHKDAAQLIRDHAIDVLIDLSGHSSDNRLPVFALRPAPVQIGWLGYFASTGVAEIDYLLADQVSVPPGEESTISERIWRLPDTRMCYTPIPDWAAPAVAPLPMLARGHVTFGCFQRFFKINDGVLALWGRLFGAMPQARLFLQSAQCASPVLVRRMLERLASVGIREDRVTTRESTDHLNYLTAHAQVDINLDTFPYTGGTTTCEALWMGVPTLTIVGGSMLARQGEAMMTCAGLAQWVAADADDFIAKALSLTSEPAALAASRAAMRGQVRASPLFDTPLFARRFEEALVGIWHERAAEATQSVEVSRAQ